MSVILIAAVGRNGVIGRDGRLPWRLRSDLKHFRDLTFGHPVVMGRRTYAAIGKPLSGRTNIVVTHDPAFSAAGAVVAAAAAGLAAVAAAGAAVGALVGVLALGLHAAANSEAHRCKH